MASRVVTYRNDAGGCFCQLQLNSGERILISIAQTGIQIRRLALAGMIPREIIATWSVEQIPGAMRLFADPRQPTKHPLDAIKDQLARLDSIPAVRAFCDAGSRQAQEQPMASSRPSLRRVPLKPKPWSPEYAAMAAGWLLGDEALKITQQLSDSLCQIRLDLESSSLPSERKALLAIDLQAFMLEVTARLLPVIMPSAPVSEITRAMANFTAAILARALSVDESEIPRGIEFIGRIYSATASNFASYPLATTSDYVLTGEFDAQLAEFVFARSLTAFLASSTDLSTDIMREYYQRILFAVMETTGPLLQAMDDALTEAKDFF